MSFRRYAAFGLCIESEIPLPDLPPAEGEPDVCIRFGTVPRRGKRAPAGNHEEIRIYRIAGAFHIMKGREIVVDPMPGADATALRVILLGSVMAYLMRQRGWLPLHASGIRIDGHGILFLGISGAGKSTTAAAFHALGHSLITDDVGAVRLVNGVCMVQPALPHIRLFDDSRQILGDMALHVKTELDKHSCRLTPGPELAIPVKRIYTLEFSEDGIEISRLPLLNAVTAISMNTFAIRRRMTPDALSVHVRDCVAVANSTSVSRLLRPRSFNALTNLVRSVVRDVQNVEL